MSKDNQNPAAKLTDEELEGLIDSCKGQPASLTKSQVFEFDEWYKRTGAARRAALLVASKTFDELENAIVNDRELAVSMADIQRCAEDVAEGLKLMRRIVMQSQVWILVALSARDDYAEILDEVKGYERVGDDDTLH